MELCAVYDCFFGIPWQAWLGGTIGLVVLVVLLYLNSRSKGPVMVSPSLDVAKYLINAVPTGNSIYWLSILFTDGTRYEVLTHGMFVWDLTRLKLTCTFDNVGMIVVLNAADYAVICQADSSKEPVSLSYDNVASAELSHIHYTKNP
ncbi:hypothetical protein KAZ57_03945 [Patescibacteria group bacterium]|nr:hypothetical protein [Patescibacteria group bacterium]